MANLESQINAMLSGESMTEGTFWNYYNPNKEGFAETLVGTVTKISFAQERQYQTHEPLFWDDGNPKMMFRLHIKDANNNTFLFDIKPKSQMMMEDFIPACPSGNLQDLLGNLVSITAQQNPVVNGQVIPFSAAMRRKFTVQVLGAGQHPSEGVDQESFKRLMNSRASQQQSQQQPQQQTAMDPRLAASLQAAQQAGARNSAERMLQQQFPGAVVTQAPTSQPVHAPQVAPGQMPPMDVYDSDVPF